MTTHPLRSNFFFGFSVAAFAIGMLSPSSAFAVGPLTVESGPAQSLGGDQPYFYSTVTIKNGGTLSVIPVGTMGGTGRLHIKANKIILQAGGTLDAAGSGSRGANNAAGTGMGGGGYAVDAAGGGGAYFGNGGAGTNTACATGLFGVGGVKYGVADTFGLGSAGGAGGKSPGPIGGSGGGSIILEAAQIEINGTINVAGDPGLSISGVGSGGGAGGEIRLKAASFIWGPKAVLIATGGVGGKALNSSGGSGGGGLIWVRGGPTPPAEVVFDVAGGASAESCAGGEGKGQDGVVDIDVAPTGCPDLDGDGRESSLCNMDPNTGGDCDDADPNIKPGADDKCDAYDNDCNGTPNDGPNVCAAGLVCENNSCVAPTLPDAGADADSGSAAPEVVEYRGGCSVPSSPTSAAPLAALGFAVALGAHLTRRNRRKP